MIGTESEMALRRCTPALVIYVLDALNPELRNGLQAGGAPVVGNCIGSKCAQWCWYDYTRDGLRTYRENGEVYAKGRAEPGPTKKSPLPPRGYCGLTNSRE